MPKRSPARERAADHGSGRVVIDHAALAPDDADWLDLTQHLILWNVTIPEGFLASLPRLRLLDLRGGSGTDIRAVQGCSALRGLVVNQIRGLHDLSAIVDLDALELLSLYGLSKVVVPPSLAALANLRRLEVGQMRGLPRLGDGRTVDAVAADELLELTSAPAADGCGEGADQA